MRTIVHLQVLVVDDQEVVEELSALSVPGSNHDGLSSQDMIDSLQGPLCLPCYSGDELEAFLVDLGLMLQLPSQHQIAPEGCLGEALSWALEAGFRAARFLEERPLLTLPATKALIHKSLTHLGELGIRSGISAPPAVGRESILLTGIIGNAINALDSLNLDRSSSNSEKVIRWDSGQILAAALSDKKLSTISFS